MPEGDIFLRATAERIARSRGRFVKEDVDALRFTGW